MPGAFGSLHEAMAARPGADPAPARESGASKLAFRADDVAAERARLVGSGVRMLEVRSFGAISLCDGLDPEGNVFQISSRPPFPRSDP
jgi:hypothetical protein